MAETLHFRVSSGLKNIIGRELINDKYIAIFELVKNSYDAGAKHVKISFDKLGTSDATITISDDGNGMSKTDIIDKWLFVAYSEKRNPSYRDSIKRAVAGAKGVGRFSCDRLGERVVLSSKVSTENMRHQISISWSDFEANSQDNFTDINVQYESYVQRDETAGTDIVISNLRESWQRADLLALKKALTQLVNPSATHTYDPFEITLQVPTEIECDNEMEEDRDKVNGVIKNDIFEVINQKTTRITVKISEDGKLITTELDDRGTFLFKTTEKSEFSLSNITCTLYFLNRAAKINFTRKMGMEAIKYGSVFVYKNGFRVYPYGEPGSDFFDIDQRKQQGFRRFLGTRELIGQLEICGEKNDLNETSSRNNGFISTHHLTELKTFFMEYVLKPLEKYVVQIVQWGDTEDFLGSAVELSAFTDIPQIVRKIKARSKEASYLAIVHNQELANYILQQKKKQEKPEEQIRKIAVSRQDNELLKAANAVQKQTKKLKEKAEQASQEAERAQEKLEEAEAELTATKKQVSLLSARADLTAQDAVDAMHIMKGYADTIDSMIAEIYETAEDDDLEISPLRAIFDSISQTCKKIMNSYNLVMRTGYAANSDESHEDLVHFVNVYCGQFNRSLQIVVENPDTIVANVRYNPLEFSIIIDNLVDNARKANASKLVLRFEQHEYGVVLRCSDDGYGIKPGVNVERLFEAGYTTTSGSGIGLSTVKKYIEKIGGRVKFNPEYTAGFEVILYLRQWT